MKVSIKQKIPGIFRVMSLGLIMIFIFTMAGCSSKSGDTLGTAKLQEVVSQEAGSSRNSSSTVEKTSYQDSASPKKMSNQWTFELEVGDSRQANACIIAQAEQLQGYLVESHIGTRDDQIEANLVVKVPADKAQAMVVYIQNLGYVKEEEKTSRDVSDVYYDTEARLKVLVAEEDRLLNYMQAKTANIQDILAVEKEISRVRQERESLQARFNLLNNQVDYTSFVVSLTENQTALKAPKGTLGKAGQGFVSSLGLLVKFINGFFIVLVSLLPFLILFGGLLCVILRWYRRRKAKKASSHQEAAAPIYAPGYRPADDDNDKQEE